MPRPRRNKAPSPNTRVIKPGHRRVTVELTDAMASKLKAYAGHRYVEFGAVVEDALRVHLRKFYVVDGTSGNVDVAVAEPVRLAVMDVNSSPSLEEGETPTAA
jgi:hypothetical protein